MPKAKKAQNGEHKLLLRIDSKTNEILKLYAQIRKTTKSEIIRKSIYSAMLLNVDNPKNTNPQAIISQSMLHFLFDRCTNEELRDLAQISYELSMTNFDDHTFWQNLIDGTSIQKSVEMLVNFVLSSRGQNWFDECDYIFRGSHVSIYGNHNMGPNFHVFIIILLELYFKDLNYEIIRQRQNLADLISQSEDFDMIHVKRKFYKFSATFAPKK